MEPSPESNSKFDNEDNFIYRYNLKPAEMYSKERYLTTIMRLSIFEKILTKYIFQNQPESKEFSLYPFLEDVQGDANLLSKFKNIMEFSAKNYEKEHPLYFFGEIAQEILRILKEDDLSLMKFDKYILKIEFLLAWHFESNFYPRRDIFGLFESLNDNIYLHNGITNYIYSIESINTIEHFLKVFEKQTLCTRIDGDLQLIDQLFCNEKVYYFYCDIYKKKKLVCGNMIKYLL